MTVKEYADELGLSIQEVLKKCKELSLSPTGSDDILTDDDIIFLDNTLSIYISKNA